MFWIAVFTLSLLASLFVLVPVFLTGNKKDATGKAAGAGQGWNRESLNVAIYQQRLEELGREDLSGEEYELLKRELQQSLLADVDSGSGDAASDRPVTGLTPSSSDRKITLAVAVFAPLMALVLYSDWGFSWGASSDVEVARALKESVQDPEYLTRALDKLAAQLEAQPDNHQGWFLLAKSSVRVGRYHQAVSAFRQLTEKFGSDAHLAAYYAEALYLSENRKVTDQVRQALEKALKLNPHEVSMLEIKGIDAYQSGQPEVAVRLFKRALATNPESRRASMLKVTIARIEKELGVDSPEAEAVVSIEVSVALAAGLSVPNNHTVFVFARAHQGPPMPLAITRFTVADLPSTVSLSESMAMMPGMSLADFDQVEVVARISARGLADPGPEDYEVISPAIDMTKGGSKVKLVIRHRLATSGS